MNASGTTVSSLDTPDFCNTQSISTTSVTNNTYPVEGAESPSENSEYNVKAVQLMWDWSIRPTGCPNKSNTPVDFMYYPYPQRLDAKQLDDTDYYDLLDNINNFTPVDPRMPTGEAIGKYYQSSSEEFFYLAGGTEQQFRDGTTNGEIYKQKIDTSQWLSAGTGLNENVLKDTDKCPYGQDWLTWMRVDSNYANSISPDIESKINTLSTESIDTCKNPLPFSKLIPLSLQSDIIGLISEIALLTTNIKATISEIEKSNKDLNQSSGYRDELLNEKALLLQKMQHIINVGTKYADAHTITGQHETMFLGQRSNYLHLIGWCILFSILISIFIYLTLNPSAVLSKYLVILIIIYIVITLLVMLWNYLYALNLV